MNIYLLVFFIAIIAGNILFNIFKKSQGEGSKAPDVVTIIGLVIGLALGIAPVFLSGVQEWPWHTTVLVLGSALVIGRILYSWRKGSGNKQKNSSHYVIIN
ncbi:hypothetical protein UY286_09785 [Paenibacillus polymyxa]|uniref:hypothetical protein n=1 Tax=Paenibacillus polymyxa TaxID=1406 RepID=UPI002AB3735E|nr:hypothetical protein [Paenibacillus polymyxa]MDY7991293.1 hypothetical protein [Paenibacillus polymyxa]MDY8117733.1 hypothetical protein [Paenibacillus polymyxa]